MRDDPRHVNCAAILPGLHVDLGRSYSLNQPVVAVLAVRIPRTLLLALAVVFIQSTIGVLIGVFAARFRSSLFDRAAVASTLVGISAPTFVIGLVLQFVFAYKLHLLPLDGFGQTAAEHARSLVLPAVTLGVFGVAYYTRLVRQEVIEYLRHDYIRTARAKGLSEGTIVIRHALRNALAPLIAVLGLDVGALVGGALVTESIFRWPGLGQLSVNALLNRDGPLIVGTVIVASVAIVLSNALADVCTVVLDPRQKG